MSRIASLFLAAGSLSIAGAAPVGAQCRLCDSPTTTRPAADAQDAIQLEIETSLSFDRLVMLGAGAGSALIRPDGSQSADGSIAAVGPRAMVGTAVIRGEPGRAVRVDLPSRIELHSFGGGVVSFDDVTSDLPALPRLDGAGRLSFRFGGRIRMTGDAEGDYRGDLPITVEYQ